MRNETYESAMARLHVAGAAEPQRFAGVLNAIRDALSADAERFMARDGRLPVDFPVLPCERVPGAGRLPRAHICKYCGSSAGETLWACSSGPGEFSSREYYFHEKCRRIVAAYEGLVAEKARRERDNDLMDRGCLSVSEMIERGIIPRR